MHLAYDLLDGYDALVLVDAVPGRRRRPATVHVLEVERRTTSTWPARTRRARHDPGGRARRSARAGRHAPADYVVSAARPADLGEGIGLSERSPPPSPSTAVDALLGAGWPVPTRRRGRLSHVPRHPRSGRRIVDGYAGQIALVDVEGAPAGQHRDARRPARQPGEWVLIHMGFAVETVDEEPRRRSARWPGCELMGSGRRRHRRVTAPARRASASCRASGFRPVRLRHRHRARADRLGAQHSRRRRRSRSRATRTPSTSSAADCATTRRRWPMVGGVTSQRAAAARRDRVHDRRQRPGGGGRTLASPDVATCADCLAELRRPGRPPLPAPVHHLHQLRPAVHHHHRAALRPGRPPRWPASRCAPPARASTTTRPTGASTPSRSPAPTAARRLRARRARRGRHATGDDALGAARAAARRRADRRGEGPRRLPPRLRRPQRARPSPSCAAASGAATSRSR